MKTTIQKVLTSLHCGMPVLYAWDTYVGASLPQVWRECVGVSGCCLHSWWWCIYTVHWSLWKECASLCVLVVCALW